MNICISYIFSIEYKKEILYPVLSSVARRHGQGDMYEGMINNEEPLIIPRGASEFEVRLRQVQFFLTVHACIPLKKKIAWVKKDWVGRSTLVTFLYFTLHLALVTEGT